MFVCEGFELNFLGVYLKSLRSFKFLFIIFNPSPLIEPKKFWTSVLDRVEKQNSVMKSFYWTFPNQFRIFQNNFDLSKIIWTYRRTRQNIYVLPIYFSRNLMMMKTSIFKTTMKITLKSHPHWVLKKWRLNCHAGIDYTFKLII